MLTIEKRRDLYVVKIIDHFTWDDVHEGIKEGENSQWQGGVLDMEKLLELSI